MRASLPVRIFFVHLVFSVLVASIAVWLISDAFERYEAEWERSVETRPTEDLFSPMANEIARSILVLKEGASAPEVIERDQQVISQALRRMVQGLDGIESLVVLDNERVVRYSNDPLIIGQGFTDEEAVSRIASNEVVRYERTLQGREITELIAPVFDGTTADGAAARRRLGSWIVRFTGDPKLMGRVPEVNPPTVEKRRFVVPLIGFLAALALSSVLITAFSSLPVYRLERALVAFKERDYKGELAADGRPLEGHFAGAFQAIKEMGGRLAALDDREKEREALLATLSQSLEEGMIALDPQGQVVSWNQAALRIVLRQADGADTPQLIGRVLRDNPRLTEAASDDVFNARRELEILRPDGTRVPVVVSMVPFESRPGQMGTLLMIRDMLALHKVEAHLLEAGRFAVLAHLAAGLAHEIRNPLHAIGLNAGVVEQYVLQLDDSRQQHAMNESLNSIKDETRRLTDLLNNYLGLFRPEQDTGPVDVRDLCERVQRLLYYPASQSSVRIELHGDESLPPVEGFSARLQQAILNLVMNSIQAMPDGGSVVLRTSFDEGFVQIAVEDSGPGVSHEVQQDLFNMRVTTKPGGAGLGLPLVRLIAEAHGGQVRYQNGDTGGAAFVLRLPTRAGAAA